MTVKKNFMRQRAGNVPDPGQIQDYVCRMLTNRIGSRSTGTGMGRPPNGDRREHESLPDFAPKAKSG
mgnify:CR=1 FL=1